MATSTARAHWEGTTKDGRGSVSTDSNALHDQEMTWKARVGDDAGTTPEELLAAAWSSCYCMAFSGSVAKAGYTPGSVDVEATISFGPKRDGEGFEVREGSLLVRAEIADIDDDAFQKIAAGAKAGCPVSVALGTIAQQAKLDAQLSEAVVAATDAP